MKNKLLLRYDDFHFYLKIQKFFGELWKMVKKPMLTDTRYREDFLWLLRLYQLLTGSRKEITDLDALNEAVKDAIVNAKVYKPNLEM